MHSNSKERGMIFNSEMVRAILSGQKTQTRRVMKPQPVLEDAFVGGITKPTWIYKGTATPSGWIMHNMCPFGAVGDLIWVRETHHLDQYGYTYKADRDWIKDMRENGAFGCDEKWTPSMHMKRCASRILLEITNVRVERLNDISEKDAKAEGVSPSAHTITPPEAVYRVGFGELWRSIYGDENWEKNPWVWVIEFKRVQEQRND
ncbi:hypothetical protein EYZ01_15715 [Hafnia alvei]|uniref:hypothetical protein n=1 Tax=Hafnia alvei TaxID=569 RepID=UPI001033A1D5|nr:hypothetical protein [Hafnia alvei]TBL37700.1 hypothetical protein EYZ01_15715 [Hafnia alvei]